MSERPSEAPEWLWYGVVEGKPVVTFGRWPKAGAQWRYKWAEIQPTEHDHPKRCGQGLPMTNIPTQAPGASEADWTCDQNGRCNSSELFENLCAEVEQLIRDDARALISGNAGSTARLIMAQLAHVHGLRPHNRS